METVGETIDLDGLLVEAGLKRAPRSSDVVVAPNGTAALVYFAEPEGALPGKVAGFLRKQDWVGRVFEGDGLAETGLPTGSSARIAITMRSETTANPHGVAGRSAIVRDTLEPKDVTGFGQHGGLGVNEQSPFLFVSGGGFAPGAYSARSSLIDIAPSVLRHLGLDTAGTDGRPLPRQPAGP